MSNVTITRRRNALAIFQAFAESALAGGAAPKGLEQSFAVSLQISPSMWSQIKASRPIGDKLARQIEALSDRPTGWLDEAREAFSPTDLDKAYLDLALQAWRKTNGSGRRRLRLILGRIAETGVVPEHLQSEKC